MITVTVQIGNSDNKLTQQEWSRFVKDCHSTISLIANRVHFHACSDGGAPWQNAAWVFELEDELDAMRLQAGLTDIRGRFNQDSIAWTEGQTVFL